jgi:hypothetical protein
MSARGLSEEERTRAAAILAEALPSPPDAPPMTVAPYLTRAWAWNRALSSDEVRLVNAYLAEQGLDR